jgi:hypothetical protein
VPHSEIPTYRDLAFPRLGIRNDAPTGTLLLQRVEVHNRVHMQSLLPFKTRPQRLRSNAAVSKLVFALGLVTSLVVCAGCFGQSSGKTTPSASARRTIPAQERQALIALYEATDGNNWKEHDGWLGPVGTECDWHGIICGTPVPPLEVTAIELSENNLSGTIPDAVTNLTRLDSLFIFGNHLSGKVPNVLIQKWLSGSLWLNVETSMLTDVSEVDFESSASALLCARHRIVLRSDGTAMLFTERCRGSKLEDRRTFCEVKQGRIGWHSFAALAWLLNKNDFFALKSNYSFNVTDSVFNSTRVIRGGKTYEVVEYAGGSPFELWVIQGFIEGFVSSADWEKTSTTPRCPRWDESKARLAK